MTKKTKDTTGAIAAAMAKNKAAALPAQGEAVPTRSSDAEATGGQDNALVVQEPAGSVASETKALPERDHAPKSGRRWWFFGRKRKAQRPVRVSIFRPIVVSVAALIFLFGLVSLGTTFTTSLLRHLEYSRTVQPDGTAAKVLTALGRPARDIGLVYRSIDGEARQVLVERDAVDGFVNEALLSLEAERAAAKAAASADIEQLFALTFADREAAINAYADWFFAWKRSYVLLTETVASTFTHLTEVGQVESLKTAVGRDLQDYFMRHYSEHVLKPERRDQLISRGFENAARDVHARYLHVVAQSDLRMQLFLARNGRAVQTLGADKPATDLALDWDSQRFHAPTYLMEDRAFDAVTGLGTVVTAGTLGAYVLRPVLQRAGSRAFTMLGQRTATAMTARIALAEGGAAVGTVLPVSPLGGAVIGGLVGLAVDYAVNEAGEALNRENFLKANGEALDSTISVWQERLEASLHAAIDVWFDDAREAIVVERLAAQ